MCLVAVAVAAHERYPLIVAGNRDELHARPSASAVWWYDQPRIFGGRDLVAGGSWLAVNREGEIAVVLNYPGRALLPGDRSSRGALVTDFLTGTAPAAEFLRELDSAAGSYAGFCLVAGSVREMRMTASPAPEDYRNRALGRGVHVFSNSPPDRPWPKDGYLRERLTAMLAGDEITPAAILGLLERQAPVAPLDDAGLPAHAATPFVTGDEYGTRASTVVLFEREGLCRFVERRFGPGGAPLGETDTAFRVVS